MRFLTSSRCPFNMALYTKLKCFVVMIFLMMHERTDALHCEESRNTLIVVPKCPRNEQEWKSQEQNVSCQTINQTCVSPEKFLYHCVLNAEGTKLLEVCAPSRIIYGSKCAEFNDGGSIIQGSFVTCGNFVEPCPEKYLSTEAFKYQPCYQFVKREVEDESTSLVGHIIVVVVGSISLVGFGVYIYWVCKKFSTGGKVKTPKAETTGCYPKKNRNRKNKNFK